MNKTVLCEQGLTLSIYIEAKVQHLLQYLKILGHYMDVQANISATKEIIFPV